MPMNKALYPSNWGEIALAVKEQANWTCQQCGKVCRRSGESIDVFESRLQSEAKHLIPILYGFELEDADGLDVDDYLYAKRRPQRFTLTVAHLNHEPSDCRSENLRALCAPCHCQMDLRAMALKKRLKAERAGQLSLLLEENA